MKVFHPSHIRSAILVLVIAPMLLSIAWRQVVGPCDYIAQFSLLILSLLPPCFTPQQSGPGKHFGLVFLATFIWGIWRVAYFDVVTHNDIPGIGYLMLPFFMVVLSFVAFLIWAWLGGRASKRLS